MAELKETFFSDLIATLKNKKAVARIGILRDSARSGLNEEGLSNAEIGKKHEFGIGVPERSFLRMPIATYLEERLQSYGTFDQTALDRVIKEKSLKPWLDKIGFLGKELVLEAFDSGGFGQWRPLALYTTLKKGHDTILIETEQLKNSISWDVENV